MEPRNQKVFLPLTAPPSDAQVDFEYTLANVNGQLRKVAFFAMVPQHGNACFVMAFQARMRGDVLEGGCLPEVATYYGILLGATGDWSMLNSLSNWPRGPICCRRKMR
jgi:hypothetical protein